MKKKLKGKLEQEVTINVEIGKDSEKEIKKNVEDSISTLDLGIENEDVEKVATDEENVDYFTTKTPLNQDILKTDTFQDSEEKEKKNVENTISTMNNENDDNEDVEMEIGEEKDTTEEQQYVDYSYAEIAAKDKPMRYKKKLKPRTKIPWLKKFKFVMVGDKVVMILRKKSLR